jgi:phosphatidyl-myo-inositol dimannoside synthase
VTASAADSYRQPARSGEPSVPGRVLLLAPSCGLGGGIERYVETLEWAFAAQGAACQRLDLCRPGVRAHLRMLAAGRGLLRASREPVRLVVGHPSLLPVATLLAREQAVCGVSVLCHGREVWEARLRPRRIFERALMRGPGVRAVAVSSFTAGTIARDCRAAVLPPALAQGWFETLVGAADAARGASAGIQLVTAFRLADWREKGFAELAEAVTALGRPDVRLVVCGSGEPPAELLRLVASHRWCTLLADLTDRDLAEQLAPADLFVLASRTRLGWRAYGEGFGLVLLEAQVAGTPVIAPAHGGSAGAYVEGVTGTAPADETAETLSMLLSEMLKDPARLAWMGSRAAEWARESFAPDRYATLVASRLL